MALFFCVGATNIINFMDGINGITAAYGFAMLLPIALLNHTMGFIDESYLIVAIIGLIVFSIFNFRPKGKAKCFAGDVGSIGIAFIILFALGKLMLATQDVTWIVFFLVYGYSAGDLARVYISLPEYSVGSLDIFCRCCGCAGCGVCAV